MGTSTGQFHPDGSGVQSDPGGLAVLGSTLFYIGNGQSASTIHVKLCDLSAEDVTSSDAWLKYDLPGEQIQFYDNDAPQTDSGVAATVFDGKIYCFWSDTNSTHDNNCYATSTGDASFSKSAPWHKHIRLYSDPSGDEQLSAARGPLEAFVYDGKITVLCMQNSKQKVRVMRFDPAAIYLQGSDYHWVPEAAMNISVSEIDSAFGNFKIDDGKIGSTFSADWVTDGTNNYLALACYSDSDDGVNFTALKFDADGLPTFDGHCLWIADGSDGACVRRDPAGRARVYMGDSSHNLQVVTIQTGNGWDASAAPLNGASHDLMKSARAVFAVRDAVAVTDTRTEAECYEFVLYSDRSSDSYGDIMCQGSFFGTVVTDRRACTVDYSDGQTEIPFVLESVMEVFPLPAEGSTGINPGTELVDVIYGTSKSDAESHSVEETLMFGAKTEGDITVSNVGVVWETNFQAGPTSASGGSERTTSIERMVSWTVGGGGEIGSAGTTWFAGVRMTQDDYYLVDASGQRVSGGPQMTTFYPLSGTRHGGTFNTYAAEPGNLQSYTRDSINQRMNALFPPGCAYRNTYGDWSDYVRDVIEANAVELGAEGMKPLQFVLSPGGEWSGGFQSVSSSFVESGWKITNEAWAGLSAGISTKEILFGWEFGASIKAMIGSTYEMTTNTRSETETSWGIDMQLTSAAQSFAFSESYTVLMYLLPANERWTAELKALSGTVDATDLDQIDPASQPMRIFYVVEF